MLSFALRAWYRLRASALTCSRLLARDSRNFALTCSRLAATHAFLRNPSVSQLYFFAFRFAVQALQSDRNPPGLRDSLQ